MTGAVTQLGYVGFEVADLASWRRLTGDILACEVVETQGQCLVRIDERPFRIALIPAATDAVSYVSWEVAGKQEFHALIDRLRTYGVAVEIASAQEANARQVTELTRLQDPGGFHLELFHGAAEQPDRLQVSRAHSGFKTGPLGLGHLVLHYPNYDEAVRFYIDLLGFRVSDTADLANSKTQATFLHCNPRHHSIAIIKSTPERRGAVSHFMLEANVMEDVGRVYDLCRKEEFPLALSIGQHTNDRMLSFYIKTPSGFSLEFGFGGIEIDDEIWEIQHWETGSYWGHQRNAAP